MLQRPSLLVCVLLFSGHLCSADTENKFGYDYIPAVGGWLRLQKATATAADARLRCQIEGGILATPTTSDLTTAMLKIMGSQPTNISSVLIGEPSSNLYLKWAPGEPDNDNLNSVEDCLAMTDAGQLADVKCTTKHTYFCYKDGVDMAGINCGTWDKDYNLDPRTGSCYKFHSEPRSWYAAEAACRAEHAHLAVINSDAESQVLKAIFGEHTPGSLKGVDDTDFAYIGFWDRQGNEEWRTIYGETFNETGFGTWGKDEPNHAYGREHCGSLRRDGLLNDYFCDAHQAFICEITTK